MPFRNCLFLNVTQWLVQGLNHTKINVYESQRLQYCFCMLFLVGLKKILTLEISVYVVLWFNLSLPHIVDEYLILFDNRTSIILERPTTLLALLFKYAQAHPFCIGWLKEEYTLISGLSEYKPHPLTLKRKRKLHVYAALVCKPQEYTLC